MAKILIKLKLQSGYSKYRVWIVYSGIWYLGLSQVSSLVSHLRVLSVWAAKRLFNPIHPLHKLTHVLLIAGPLWQSTFQLTVTINKAKLAQREQTRFWTAKSNNPFNLSTSRNPSRETRQFPVPFIKDWQINCPMLTFYTGLRQTAVSPTSLWGLGSVCESPGLPQLKCSSGPPLPASRAFLAGSPSPDGQLVRPTDRGEHTDRK